MGSRLSCLMSSVCSAAWLILLGHPTHGPWLNTVICRCVINSLRSLSSLLIRPHSYHSRLPSLLYKRLLIIRWLLQNLLSALDLRSLHMWLGSASRLSCLWVSGVRCVVHTSCILSLKRHRSLAAVVRLADAFVLCRMGTAWGDPSQGGYTCDLPKRVWMWLWLCDWIICRSFIGCVKEAQGLKYFTAWLESVGSVPIA
jgi:hypothetical protein